MFAIEQYKAGKLSTKIIVPIFKNTPDSQLAFFNSSNYS